MADFGAFKMTIDKSKKTKFQHDLIVWNTSLSVNSPTLDLHHQILIGCLNRMICVQDGWQDSLPAIRRELALIINYCKIHFFIEESAMHRSNVEKSVTDRHSEAHRKILNKMTETVRAFHADPSTFPFNGTLQFLKVWLWHHIQDGDRRDYGEKLRRDPSIEGTLSAYRYAEISRKLNLREDGRPNLAGRTVAVVEGDAARRESLASVLRDSGLNVTAADSVVDAETIVEIQKTPELLFLDWSLPGAKPFARHLYRTRNTSVIVCHDGDPLDIIDACDVDGVANLLPYPADANVVLSVARETLDAFAPLRALVLERLAVSVTAE